MAVHGCLVLVLGIKRNLKFQGGSSEISLHNGGVFAHGAHWLVVVRLDLLDDSRLSCRAVGFEEAEGMPVAVYRYCVGAEYDLFAVHYLDVFNVSSGTEGAYFNHLLEGVVLLEIFVSDVVSFGVEFVLSVLNFVPVPDSNHSHAVLGERSSLV